MSAAIPAALLILALPAVAQHPAPFASADAKAGQKLVDRDCIACHVQRFGNATSIYTRADRRVTTAGQLLAQVQRCNQELKTSYFPDDEENVAAFLNDAYYKFRP
jgi:cytochrome c553